MSKAMVVYGRNKRVAVRGRKRKRQRAMSRRMTQSEYIANAGLNMFSRVAATPLPTKLKTKFRFSDRCLLDIPADPVDEATAIYSANGLFDPVVGVGAA